MTSLVTTPLIDRIGSAYQVKTFRVLTGFKYIAEKIRQWELEPSGGYSFLFGAEESHGYLLGTSCRDKDGIAAACLFAQMSADLKAQGKTCLDLLHEIYSRFGIFQESGLSLTFSSGKEGVETIQHLMQTLRDDPPASLGDQTVIQTIDYLQKVGELPRSDILQWMLEDGTSLIIRPSGTEPKLKVYLSAYQPPRRSITRGIKECRKHLDQCSHLLQVYFQGCEQRISSNLSKVSQ